MAKYETRAYKVVLDWALRNGVVLPHTELSELVDEVTKLQMRAHREHSEGVLSCVSSDLSSAL